MTPSEGETRAEEGAEARLRKIAQAIPTPKGRQRSRTPPFENSRMWRDLGSLGGCDYRLSAAYFTGKREELLAMHKEGPRCGGALPEHREAG